MIDRTPSGTRDVLPDEMRELRALMERMRGVFDRAGYGEVYTPALEYERTFDHERAPISPSYRLFDEHGNVLVLRADMTVPIARLVASRYPTAPTPMRFCYFAHAYRSVRPQPWAVARVHAGRSGADRRPGSGGHRRGADGAL